MTIKELWPIDEIENQGLRLPAAAGELVPHYRCGKLFRDDYSSVAAPRDADDCIQIRPTPFRFKAGDNVTFDSMKARGNTSAAVKQLEKGPMWTSGKIIMVDICEEGTDYAAYESYKH